jgi:peptide/nickel transport system permease protein
MLKYIGKRFFHSLVMIFGIMVIIFVVTHILGDPVALMLDPASTKQEFELMRHQLGLDQPLHLQFFVFLKNAVHGDFGESLRAREPAMRLVLQHLPATIELTVAAMIFMLLIGVPVGILSAAKPYSLGDRDRKTLCVGRSGGAASG